MTGIKSFNKTGERFANEGEYAGSGFPSPSDSPAVPSVAYSSEENINKVYATPSDATQQHFDARKPLDCGTTKILSNNISHLVYQKCRTLAVLNGPGQIGYIKSDLQLIDPFDSSLVVLTPYPGIQSTNTNYDGYYTDQFREIGWSFLSSRRLGPFFAITDRKFQYQEDTLTTNPLSNNSSNIRNMVLCISGYKAKIPSPGTGDQGIFRFHVVVTNDGAPPSNPNAGIIPLNADSRCFIEALDATSVPVEKPIPSDQNILARNSSLQGAQAITVALNSLAGSDDFNGPFKLFIPIDCIGNITTTNVTYASVGVAEYYVHVGWYAGQTTNSVSCISLHEIRDPGSYIAS